VPLSALALALTAAALHAFWNLVVARGRDAEAATAVVLALAVVLYAPVAAATWRLDASVAPYAVASAALELAYIALLAAAYARAELSVVYPVARGLAPVLVLAGAVTVLSAGTSPGEAAGVGLVAAGVFLVRGAGGRGAARGLAFGAAIACCIAGYTLVDSRGVRHADPFAYLELVMVVPAAAYLLVAARARGRAALRRELGAPTVAAAAACFGAYGLALEALRLSSAASVAAVRETSVVIAVALAAPVLGEPVGARKLGGSVLVAGGVALLAST
jgi:drug/metabolite transporter (DMT)-like permease